MKIDSLKDLEKLMRLCRKQGIKTFRLDNVEFVLDDQPVKHTQKAYNRTQKEYEAEPGVFDPGHIPAPQVPDIIPHDGLTEEQLLFGSSDPSVWETEAKQ